MAWTALALGLAGWALAVGAALGAKAFFVAGPPFILLGSGPTPFLAFAAGVVVVHLGAPLAYWARRGAPSLARLALGVNSVGALVFWFGIAMSFAYGVSTGFD